jgi:hypothetical protein
MIVINTYCKASWEIFHFKALLLGKLCFESYEEWFNTLEVGISIFFAFLLDTRNNIVDFLVSFFKFRNDYFPFYFWVEHL